MNTASLRTALIAAIIVAIGAFTLFGIGGADAQQTCIQPLAGNGTISGTWSSACLSENTPLGDTYYPIGTRYARFYTFTLSETSTVTVELKSSADTYMYLMQDKGKAGAILHYNDDIAPNEDTNSRISQSLSTGDYTIEATTYEIETTGSFTLTVSGLPDPATPTTTPTAGAGDTPTVTPTPKPGQNTPTPTPTSTPTRTPTPAPTQPPVPADVLNRLTVLETRTATQQGLIATMESKITALDSRVATLEASAAKLTATPTAAKTPTATPTTIPTATTYTPTPIATATPEATATNSPTPVATSTPLPTVTNTSTPVATATPQPTATNTPTPRPTPVAAFTGRSIFQELDRLGANEFNSRYSGKYIEISAYWDGVINTTGIFRNYYGVAVIEEPSEELVFIGTILFGQWSYSYTEPHDGKIIVGAGAGSIFASRRTYTCRVDEYASGTLDLKSCRSVSSTSNENSEKIPARVFESYSSGGHK